MCSGSPTTTFSARGRSPDRPISHPTDAPPPSSVFRGMLSAGSGALRIELTDPAMEDSGTLNRALDFIVNAVFDSNDIKHMVAVGLFLKKYDCAASAKQFVLFIKQVPCAPRVKTFILGASLDDEELCATTLQHPLPQWEKGVRGANISLDAHTVPNSGCQFNSNGWTISWTAATPLRYKWALDRAWRHHEDSAELAPAFRKYLGRAKGECGGDSHVQDQADSADSQPAVTVLRSPLPSSLAARPDSYCVYIHVARPPIPFAYECM